MGCGFKSEHAVARCRVMEDFLWIFRPLSAAIEGFVEDYELNFILNTADFILCSILCKLN